MIGFVHRKTAHKASLLLAGILLSGSAFSRPPEKARTKTNTEERPSFLGLLPWSESPESPAEVRRLSTSRHPEATKQLLWLSDQTLTSSNHQLRLAIVEALHQRSHGPQRKSVVRRLIQFFVHDPAAEALKSSRRTRDVELDTRIHRVRASAALALAQSRHDEALRVLLSYEKEGSDSNPTGTLLANSALSAFPPSQKQRLALGFERLPASPAQEAKSPHDPPPPTPKALATLSSSPEGWISGLLRVADTADLPADYFELSSWKDVLIAHPLWGLRALTCLSVRRLPALRDLALKSARQHLRSSDPKLRATSAWTISALAKDDSRRLLESNDPVILGAVLRQSGSGALAQLAFHFGKSPSHYPKELSKLATIVSLFEATTWNNRTNGDLWELDETDALSQMWLAPLASRALAMNSSLPQGHQVYGWLEAGSAHQRSAAAFGLGQTDSPMARGLLVQAYRGELAPAVRRSITRALASHPQKNRTILQLISELDPDPGCRSRAQGTLDHDARGFLVSSGAKETVVFSNREAQQFPVLPDPDGFVGIVGENF